MEESTQRAQACPLCGGRLLRAVFDRRLFGRTWHLMRCLRCSLCFTDPRPRISPDLPPISRASSRSASSGFAGLRVDRFPARLIDDFEFVVHFSSRLSCWDPCSSKKPQCSSLNNIFVVLNFGKSFVSMNARQFIIRDSCRPFRARAGGGSYPGFRPPSLHPGLYSRRRFAAQKCSRSFRTRFRISRSASVIVR